MEWFANGKRIGPANAQLFDATWDRNWEREDRDGTAYVENDRLVIVAPSKEGYLKLEPLPIDYNRDFEIEASFSIHGSGASLYFTSYDSAHYYALDFSAKGTMSISRVMGHESAGGDERFRVLLQKMNTVRIARKGSDLFLSVNGTMITSMPYDGPAGNRFGFFLPGRGAEVRVASIEARETGKQGAPLPQKESAPAKGAPKTKKNG